MTTLAQDLGGVVLLPCPFCGKKPNIGQWGAQDLTAWPDATAIECSSDLHDCPVNPSVTGYTRAEAIAAWNTRAHSAEIAGALRDAERLDALERLLESTNDGMILLHNGNGAGRGITGLGLQNTGRSLRQAIDDSAMQQGGGGGEAAA